MTKHACQQRDALVGQAGSNPIRDLGLRRVMSRDSSPTLDFPLHEYLSTLSILLWRAGKSDRRRIEKMGEFGFKNTKKNG